MHYTSGNYDAFVRPRKPKAVEGKSAWFIGAGLASMASAAFLIRDAGMPGDKITFFEELDIAGGALDGLKVPDKGFIIRGGREVEAHYECMWDLYRSIPSLETEGASVLDEFYWLDKDDPNFALVRVIEKCGQDAHTDGKLGLSDKVQGQLLNILLATRKEMENKKINDVLGSDFFESNFWWYWRSAFAFNEWHSALEFKLYMHRFIHLIEGLPTSAGLKYTKYNQFESLVQPLLKWLLSQGVKIEYGVRITDVDFDISPTRKQATYVHWLKKGVKGGRALGPNDLMFMTIGSLVENTSSGSHHAPAELNVGPAPAWDLWRRIAAKDPSFGRPDVFATSIPLSKWQSATLTTLDKRIPSYIQKVCKRDPFSGRIVSGGLCTIKDSNWILSFSIYRQPHFKAQPKGQIVGYFQGLHPDKVGNYVKKTMEECTGEEIAREWLYHMGVPVDEIQEMAATGANVVPVTMPYIDAFFMPRQAGDRPDVVPEGSVNFAFIGQFAESKQRDCIFTCEYSVRTAMESVYTLLGVERGVPEVFNSTYDIRTLLSATVAERDGKGYKVPLPSFLRDKLIEKLGSTVVGELLLDSHFIEK